MEAILPTPARLPHEFLEGPLTLAYRDHTRTRPGAMQNQFFPHHFPRLSLLVLALLAACTPPTPLPDPYLDNKVIVPPTQFRAHGDYFEIDRKDGKGWQKFLIKGVDLAVAKPGFYPGDLAAQRADYDRWLAGIAEMKANVIRVYTLHFPAFYQAFRDWNLNHPDQPLYLMHGIWLDEREDGDYITDSTALFEDEIRKDINAIHGNIVIGERFGKASGRFTADVSPWLLSWLPGDEMDGNIVDESDQKWAGYNAYNGRFLKMKEGGHPIEGWIAHEMDLVLSYEYDRYGEFRPIGWSSWPALDPIHHVTESPNFSQDVVDCNFAQFELIPPYDKGLFASYHVYPFNPEFIIYDPKYDETKDVFGLTNSYLGYMKDLKAHHPGVPVLVAEYGVPSSYGTAHVNPYAYNHGGYNEADQADIVYHLYHDVLDAGMAGSVAFEWIDEWFKRTWVTTPTMLPADRGRLWWDAMSPEESFGILSYYPLPDWSKVVDGKGDEWSSSDFSIADQDEHALAPSGQNVAQNTLKSVQLSADPCFLYIHVKLAADTVPDLDNLTLVMGISTVEDDFGNHLIEGLRTADDVSLTTEANLGFESVLILDGKRRELLVDAAYDPMPHINGEKQAGGTPQSTKDGKFVMQNQLVNNNAQYVSLDIEIDGKQWIPPPKQYKPWGVLKVGDTTKDSLANLQAGPHGTIEIRLPWHTIWVTDPSSRSVLWRDPTSKDWDVKVTPGLRIFVTTATHEDDGWHIIDALPRAAVVKNGNQGSIVKADAVPLFTWQPWDTVDHVEERRKPLFQALQTAFSEQP